MDIDITQSQIVFSAIIPFIIATLAFAIPLFLSTAERIEKNYKSYSLIEDFIKESKYRLYLANIFTSTIFILLWFFQIPRQFNFGILNKIIDNSAFYILCILTITIFINTILLSIITVRYYHKKALTERKINKHKRYE